MEHLGGVKPAVIARFTEKLRAGEFTPAPQSIE